MRKHLATIVFVAGLVACSSDSRNPVGLASNNPRPAIVDAAHGGRDGFYFLHPFVTKPGVSGPFDATLTPRARICALNADRAECSPVTLATIPTGSGLTVDPTNGVFTGQWASPATLQLSTATGTETRYRLDIQLDVGSRTLRLGYADLWVIDQQRDVKETPAGFVDVVRGKTLLFRFGVLPGTIGYVVVTPDPVELTIGETQHMSAAAFDLHNASVPSTTFTWSSADDDIAPVSSTGLVTGIANGSTFVIAETRGVPGRALVTVIGDPPVAATAVADEPSAESAPGDPFHTPFNTTLSSGGTTPVLLANDVLGSPPAEVISFGGGNLGGAVSDHAAGATVNVGTGGSLQVNANGSFSFTPGSGFTGLFTFLYRIQNSSGPSTANVAIAVGVRPAAGDDVYPATIIGNVSINTASSSHFSVLGNDAGDALTINLGASPNGDASINGDGTFTFNPAPGFTGTAVFSYTVQNGFGPGGAGSVSIPVTNPIWFVNATAAAGGDGRLGSPFNCLVDAGTACYDDSANEAGDFISIASGSYANSGALLLKDSQRVIGQGAASSLEALTGLVNAADSPALPSTGGTAPSITSAAAGIVLASSNQLHGFNVGNTGDAGITGNSFGTLTVKDVSLPGPARAGQALGLSNGSIVAGSAFGAVVSTSAADTGVSLAGVSGSVTVTGGTTVAGATMVGISVVSSGAGSFDFGNTSVSGTGATGVSLGSNAAEIKFGDLDISPAAGQRAFAANGNTGKIITTSGTIAASGNQAVQVIGPTELNMVLTSVSANGGAAPGLDLSNTSGLFSIVGTGSAGSGGTITGTTGSASIALSNVANVSLSHMSVQGNAGHGISGANIAGFALHGATLQNNGDAVSEANMSLSGLTGTASITSSTIANASGDNVLLQNSAGTLAFSLTGSTLSNDATEPNATNGLVITGSGTAVITASVQTNELQGHRLAHANVSSLASAQMTISFIDNTLTCGNDTATACNAEFVSGSNATYAYTIQNNVITGMKGSFNVHKNAGTGSMSGLFANNAIGESGMEGSGGDGLSILSQVDGVSHTTAITGNTISNYRLYGMDIAAGLGILDATVTTNFVIEPSLTAEHGIRASSGATATSTSSMCLAISNNFMTNTGSVSDFRLVQGGLATMRLPGYGGANDDNGAVVSFVSLLQQNVLGAPSGTASNTVATGGGGFVGGVQCAGL